MQKQFSGYCYKNNWAFFQIKLNKVNPIILEEEID